MSNAAHDGNGKPTLICVNAADGKTIIRVGVDPTLHYVNTSDGTTGSDLGPKNAAHDGNWVTTMIGVSSSDGVTPVCVYADASGNLLVDSA